MKGGDGWVSVEFWRYFDSPGPRVYCDEATVEQCMQVTPKEQTIVSIMAWRTAETADMRGLECLRWLRPCDSASWSVPAKHLLTEALLAEPRFTEGDGEPAAKAGRRYSAAAPPDVRHQVRLEDRAQQLRVELPYGVLDGTVHIGIDEELAGNRLSAGLQVAE